MASLGEAGALHFRGFSATTTKGGFRRFCEALRPLRPCTDPLASIGVRSLLSKDSGVYEAVNAQALAATYIGLHNDATWALTAPFAAFVCFEPAPSGGAFLVVVAPCGRPARKSPVNSCERGASVPCMRSSS